MAGVSRYLRVMMHVEFSEHGALPDKVQAEIAAREGAGGTCGETMGKVWRKAGRSGARCAGDRTGTQQLAN